MNSKTKAVFDEYSKNANKHFIDLKNYLSRMEGNFTTKMDGQNTGKMAGSFLGTLFWLVAVIIGAVVVGGKVHTAVLVIGLLIALALIAFMLVDNIMDASYYGKISSYKSTLSQLQNRAEVGHNAIGANTEQFLKSEAQGWNYILNPAPSIPENAYSLEKTVSSMESMKKGFINGAKNVSFFATAVVVSIVSGLAMIPAVRGILEGLFDSSSDELVTVVTFIGIALTITGEILLAKFLWSKTDCKVSFITPFAFLAAPIGFIALVGLGSLLTWLLKWAIYVIGILLIIAVICAIIYCSASSSDS